MKLFEGVNQEKNLSARLLRFLLIIGEAFYLNKVASDHRLLGKSNYLVALLFLLFNFLLPFKADFLIIIINGVLIYIFDAFITIYKKNKPYNEIILTGFLIATISIVINSYLIFYAWLTIALLIMRPTSSREWGMLNIGFVLPYYFIACILYLTDSFSIVAILPLFKPSIQFPAYSSIVIAKLVTLVTLPVLGFLIGSNQIGKMVLQNRKAYIIMFALFLGTVGLTALNLNRVHHYLHLSIVPATLLFAPFLLAFKKDFIPNLVIVFLILLAYIR